MTAPQPDNNRPWSIQVWYTTEDDHGRKFTAETLYWVEAPDIPSAYAKAREHYTKVGYIIPGHLVPPQGNIQEQPTKRRKGKQK